MPVRIRSKLLKPLLWLSFAAFFAEKEAKVHIVVYGR